MINISEQWARYKELLLSTKRPGIEELVRWLETNTDMQVAPASTRYHGNYEGGLVEHSLNVYNLMRANERLLNFFELPEETLILTGLLHDICKVNFYTMSMRNTKDESGKWVQVPFYQVDDKYPIGHGEKSIILAQRYIQLDEVEIAMIRNHMSFSRDDANSVSKLFSLYPEALLLSFADMEATYIVESNDLLDDYVQNLDKLL